MKHCVWIFHKIGLDGGHKSDFDDLDKHDLVYQYKKRTKTYYSNDTTVETELNDLDYENPSIINKKKILNLINNYTKIR